MSNATCKECGLPGKIIRVHRKMLAKIEDLKGRVAHQKQLATKYRVAHREAQSEATQLRRKLDSKDMHLLRARHELSEVKASVKPSSVNCG